MANFTHFYVFVWSICSPSGTLITTTRDLYQKVSYHATVTIGLVFRPWVSRCARLRIADAPEHPRAETEPTVILPPLYSARANFLHQLFNVFFIIVVVVIIIIIPTTATTIIFNSSPVAHFKQTDR